MDVADLLPFILGGAYLALRFMGARRRADQPTAERPSRQRRRQAPGVFEQMAERFETQMAEARASAQAAAEPPPVEPPPVRRARVAGQRAAGQRGYFDESASFASETQGYAHERRGFGPDNPPSEETAEQGAGRRPAPAGRPLYDPHGPRPAPASAPPALGSPRALRDAFVLQTILGRRPPLRRSPRRDAPETGSDQA